MSNTLSKRNAIGDDRKARLADTLSLAMTAQAIALALTAVIAVWGAATIHTPMIVLGLLAAGSAITGIALTARAFVECNE